METANRVTLSSYPDSRPLTGRPKNSSFTSQYGKVWALGKLTNGKVTKTVIRSLLCLFRITF